MRKGKGELTYGQYKSLYRLAKQENARLRRKNAELQDEYTKLRDRYVKMLKDKETLDSMPHVKSFLQSTDSILGALGGFPYGI